MPIAFSEIPKRSGTLDDKNAPGYVREFDVLTGDRNLGPKSILTALADQLNIKIGELYAVAGDESDDQAAVKALTLTEKGEDGEDWSLKVEYGQLTPGGGDLFDERPDRQWGSAAWEEIVDVDVDDDVIVNTAGDFYDPPVTRDAARPILTITRNERDIDFDPSKIVTHANVTNEDLFYGFEPGVALMKPITAQEMYRADFGVYWKVTYEIHFKEDGWDKQIVNVGLRELDDDGFLVPIRVNGEAVTSPVPLDASGRRLAEGAAPIVRTHRVYHRKPFMPFQLEY